MLKCDLLQKLDVMQSCVPLIKLHYTQIAKSSDLHPLNGERARKWALELEDIPFNVFIFKLIDEQKKNEVCVSAPRFNEVWEQNDKSRAEANSQRRRQTKRRLFALKLKRRSFTSHAQDREAFKSEWSIPFGSGNKELGRSILLRPCLK